MITVIIPALNEKYLNQTIQNVLENAEGNIEIIAVLDGYWPDPGVPDDPRVRIIHNTVPRGQRHSINDAARIAQGDYIMKLDAHCTVGPGFNTILERDCEYDMTMIPRMFNLDIETFKPKKHKRTDYMFIGMVDNNLRAQYYSGSGQRQPRNDTMIDEIMCCMGPCFFMHKKRFWELGGCDEGHGHWGQQGVEVACKAWLSGGRLVVNKNTWFGHWFRGSYTHDSGRKGFPYSIKQKQINAARAYSNDLWLNNKWEKQVRDFNWLIKKFNPPTWEQKMKDRKELIKLFRDLELKNGAEIGVARGQFSKFMMDTIPDLHLMSVDQYKVYGRISATRRQRQYVQAKRRLSGYPTNTLVVDTSMNVALRTPNESLDFVYIDADHKFNGVVCDVVEWAKKVRKGGIVSGHDYFNRKTYGVRDAVDLYCKHNNKKLFVTEDDGTGGPSWYFYK